MIIIPAIIINTESHGTRCILQRNLFCKLSGEFENLPLRPAKYRKVKTLQVSLKIFFVQTNGEFTNKSVTVTMARDIEEAFHELYYCICFCSKYKAFVSKSQMCSCVQQVFTENLLHQAPR